ncbi:SRPBCC domain-containing protein [Nocardia transvalensis]|uniref:SRPBCC domain-containing protein n=1 Tax=Nocardia transvalensis TaxID=37333 RepID=UPI0018941D5A|nr:SRPBCC domain-containing protein [Nocardia transvalensis]MBF6327693.1 SRPBCC domain-containing protein [Nocardia transvalensis]
MTTDHVVGLRRPPVRQETLVRSDRVHTFHTFVRTIATWWPLVPFSAGHEQVREVTFEQFEGGRVYETWSDGTEVDWGHLLLWDPPRRFTMTWTMTRPATEVELSFTELAPTLTRVTVEHRGWEHLTEAQLAAACSHLGGYPRGYNEGWARILHCLTTAAEAPA